MGRETQGFAALTPAQRSLAAGIGALHNWSRINTRAGRRAAMSAANAGRRRKLEQQADPDGTLTPDELDAAVERLRRAQLRAMSLKAAQAKAARRAATSPTP